MLKRPLADTPRMVLELADTCVYYDKSVNAGKEALLYPLSEKNQRTYRMVPVKYRFFEHEICSNRQNWPNIGKVLLLYLVVFVGPGTASDGQ